MIDTLSRPGSWVFYSLASIYTCPEGLGCRVSCVDYPVSSRRGIFLFHGVYLHTSDTGHIRVWKIADTLTGVWFQGGGRLCVRPCLVLSSGLSIILRPSMSLRRLEGLGSAVSSTLTCPGRGRSILVRQSISWP